MEERRVSSVTERWSPCDKGDTGQAGKSRRVGLLNRAGEVGSTGPVTLRNFIFAEKTKQNQNQTRSCKLQSAFKSLASIGDSVRGCDFGRWNYNNKILMYLVH